MSGVDVTFEPAGWAGVLTQAPPTALAPGPVGQAGASPIDAAAAAFGAVTNADLPETNVGIADDDADRRAHAAEAIEKFGANEDDAVGQFGDVGELAAGAQGVAGMLTGALGSLARLPQGLMQAGQGVLTPLLGAAQSLGRGGLEGLDEATLAADVDPEVDVGFGDSPGTAGGFGGGTTPAGDLGPAPVPVATPPTTPAAATTGGPPATSSVRGAPGAGMGGVPLAGGPSAGSAVRKADPPTEKRIAAPGAPNGQPVKGRATPTPGVGVAVASSGRAALPKVVKRQILTDGDAPG